MTANRINNKGMFGKYKRTTGILQHNENNTNKQFIVALVFQRQRNTVDIPVYIKTTANILHNKKIIMRTFTYSIIIHVYNIFI